MHLKPADKKGVVLICESGTFEVLGSLLADVLCGLFYDSMMEDFPVMREDTAESVCKVCPLPAACRRTLFTECHIFPKW